MQVDLMNNAHTKNYNFSAIPEYRGLSKQQFFEEVIPEQQPVVIRGFASHWQKNHRKTFQLTFVSTITVKKSLSLLPRIKNKKLKVIDFIIMMNSRGLTLLRQRSNLTVCCNA